MSIPMPDPMVEVDKQIVSSELQYTYLAPSGGLEHGTYLITTTQAEAYADARVREALEAALAEAKRVSDKYGYGYYGSEVDAVDEVREAIRALLPPTE